jgi:Septum formation
MRRLLAALTALAATVALAGCAGLPAGVDGNLTDNWPAMPEAKVSVPQAGACYQTQSTGFSAGEDSTMACTGTHASETVFVGTFTGADADRSMPPTAGGPAVAAVFADCRKNATAYLGDDFAMGPLDLTVVLPVVAAWKGGARWYRCDVVRYSNVWHGSVGGQGSVKDGLRGDRPLALTCYTVTDDKESITDEEPIACTQPHNGELAGLFTAPDVPWPADTQARKNIADKGCEGVVAAFLGLSGGRVTNPALGWGWDGFSQKRWELGNRTIRCLVLGFKGGSVNGVRFTGSVKGIGTRAPKG